MTISSMPLEELDGALMFLGRRSAAKRPQIPPFPGSRIDAARIQPILPGLQLANHRDLPQMIELSLNAILDAQSDTLTASAAAEWGLSAVDQATVQVLEPGAEVVLVLPARVPAAVGSGRSVGRCAADFVPVSLASSLPWN